MPPEVREGEPWVGSAGDNLINNNGVVTGNQLGDLLTDPGDICGGLSAIYQAVNSGNWESQVPITKWSQPWHLRMQGRINSPSNGSTSSFINEGPVSLINIGQLGNSFNTITPLFNRCDNSPVSFRSMLVLVDSCFQVTISADPCANNLSVLLELESGQILWTDNGAFRFINPGGWLCQRYLDGQSGEILDSNGFTDALDVASIPFGQLFHNQAASQRLTLSINDPHMISRIVAGDTYISC